VSESHIVVSPRQRATTIRETGCGKGVANGAVCRMLEPVNSSAPGNASRRRGRVARDTADASRGCGCWREGERGRGRERQKGKWEQREVGREGRRANGRRGACAVRGCGRTDSRSEAVGHEGWAALGAEGDRVMAVVAHVRHARHAQSRRAVGRPKRPTAVGRRICGEGESCTVGAQGEDLVGFNGGPCAELRDARAPAALGVPQGQDLLTLRAKRDTSETGWAFGRCELDAAPARHGSLARHCVRVSWAVGWHAARTLSIFRRRSDANSTLAAEKLLDTATVRESADCSSRCSSTLCRHNSSR
jgi:hypothetical protein